MSRQKSDFLLKESYLKWLKEDKKWRKTRNANLEVPELGKSYEQYLLPLDKYPGTDYFYYDVIASFLFHDEPAYAYSVLEMWGKKDDKDKSFLTYWKNYKKFIQSISIRQLIKDVNPNIISKDKLKIIRKSFNKTELYQFDGMETLINKLGEDDIIKLAIESSFFFAPQISKDRYIEINNIISDAKESLPSRKSQKNDESDKADKGKQIKKDDQLYYQDENGLFEYPIEIDGNGNAKVCQLINKYTGYQLEQPLDKKPFRHFVISHIWGRAFDPRFFTSFWNIVLIPAWVNHLLDKETIEGDIASKLKSTFKKICIKLYKLDKNDWGLFKMTSPSCGSDFCKEQYSIQIIEMLESNQIYQKVATINKKIIKIY